MFMVLYKRSLIGNPVVDNIMAEAAKGKTVIYFISKIREFCPSFNVMSMEPFSPYTTILTSKLISSPNTNSPLSVSFGCSKKFVLRSDSTFPIPMIFLLFQRWFVSVFKGNLPHLFRVFNIIGLFIPKKFRFAFSTAKFYSNFCFVCFKFYVAEFTGNRNYFVWIFLNSRIMTRNVFPWAFARI